MAPVRIQATNPNYAALLQEQLGGTAGELTAAMTYLSQSFRIRDKAIKDVFLDIATEELGHMEMVATAVNMLNGHEPSAMSATIGSVEAHTAHGLLPALANSSGVPWTAAYVDATGDLAADLLTDIAAEQRAKVVYELLYRQINDKYLRETIDFLLNREEAHNVLFQELFQKIEGTGSLKDFGTTLDARTYRDLSTPGNVVGTELHNPKAPRFQEPQTPPQ
jgi:Mn-containing catalase